jgi:hypothetical protein
MREIIPVVDQHSEPPVWRPRGSCLTYTQEIQSNKQLKRIGKVWHRYMLMKDSQMFCVLDSNYPRKDKPPQQKLQGEVSGS